MPPKKSQPPLRKPSEKAKKTSQAQPTRLEERGAESERIACLVADYFCRGYTPAEIAASLQEFHQIEINREAPYRYLAYCTQRNYLRFSPPPHRVLADRIGQSFPSLQQVDVVTSPTRSGVMERAAEMAYFLIQAKVRAGKKEIRIGCAGGRSMALLLGNLVDRLSQPGPCLPRVVECQNLVTGFDLRDPAGNPIGFLGPMVGTKPSGVEVKCLLFQAPAMIHPGERSSLLALKEIQEARQAAEECDLILTSCGSIADPHKMLQRYYGLGNTINVLKAGNCVGDMLWLPVCEDAPFSLESLTEKEIGQSPYRTMSLLELEEISDLIGRGTSVILAVAPCEGCIAGDRDRSTSGDARVVEAILRQRRQLATHLVLETSIAQKLLESSALPSPAPRPNY